MTSTGTSVSETWIRADEARLFWFIQTYRDLARLRKTLARLRTLYADSEVLVVSDGDPDPEIESECRRHLANFTLRSRMYGIEHGGALVQRILEAFLTTDADVLIKIDPDTHVRRRFSLMPYRADSSIYGTVQIAGSESNRIVSIQGGCIVIPRHAAMRLASSGLLLSERLKPPALEWAVSEMSMARAASGLTSSDQTLGWACRELGLPCKDHPEVFSRYRAILIGTPKERRAAVSHPRFEIGHFADPILYRMLGLRVRAMSREVLRYRGSCREAT